MSEVIVGTSVLMIVSALIFMMGWFFGVAAERTIREDTEK